MRPIRTILHPTDLSDNAAGALELAGTLARATGARLILLHVVPAEPPPLDGADDVQGLRRVVDCWQDPEGYREARRAELLALPVPDLATTPVRLLNEGNVVAEILRVAEEADCDLIVMGTHGRTGLALDRLGSVAAEVVQRARRPVVAVRVPPGGWLVTGEPVTDKAGVG